MQAALGAFASAGRAKPQAQHNPNSKFAKLGLGGGDGDDSNHVQPGAPKQSLLQRLRKQGLGTKKTAGSVLLFGSDIGEREQIKRWLEPEYHCLGSADAEGALELLAAGKVKFALVELSTKLRKEATTLLVAMRRRYQGVPVVMLVPGFLTEVQRRQRTLRGRSHRGAADANPLTPECEQLLARACGELGASGFLRRPLVPKMLKDRVTMLLASHAVTGRVAASMRSKVALGHTAPQRGGVGGGGPPAELEGKMPANAASACRAAAFVESGAQLTAGGQDAVGEHGRARRSGTCSPEREGMGTRPSHSAAGVPLQPLAAALRVHSAAHTSTKARGVGRCVFDSGPEHLHDGRAAVYEDVAVRSGQTGSCGGGRGSGVHRAALQGSHSVRFQDGSDGNNSGGQQQQQQQQPSRANPRPGMLTRSPTFHAGQRDHSELLQQSKRRLAAESPFTRLPLQEQTALVGAAFDASQARTEAAPAVLDRVAKVALKSTVVPPTPATLRARARLARSRPTAPPTRQPGSPVASPLTSFSGMEGVLAWEDGEDEKEAVKTSTQRAHELAAAAAARGDAATIVMLTRKGKKSSKGKGKGSSHSAVAAAEYPRGDDDRSDPGASDAEAESASVARDLLLPGPRYKALLAAAAASSSGGASTGRCAALLGSGADLLAKVGRRGIGASSASLSLSILACFRSCHCVPVISLPAYCLLPGLDCHHLRLLCRLACTERANRSVARVPSRRRRRPSVRHGGHDARRGRTGAWEASRGSWVHDGGTAPPHPCPCALLLLLLLFALSLLSQAGCSSCSPPRLLLCFVVRSHGVLFACCTGVASRGGSERRPS